MSASSTILLPHAPASVAIARERISRELSGAAYEPNLVDDIVLVASELFSNALRHARPLPSGRIAVTVEPRGDGSVEVAVADGGAGTEPRLAHASLSSLGGRGLGIVEHVAQRWGVRHDDAFTVVWAVLAGATVPGAREPCDDVVHTG